MFVPEGSRIPKNKKIIAAKGAASETNRRDQEGTAVATFES